MESNNPREPYNFMALGRAENSAASPYGYKAAVAVGDVVKGLPATAAGGPSDSIRAGEDNAASLYRDKGAVGVGDATEGCASAAGAGYPI